MKNRYQGRIIFSIALSLLCSYSIIMAQPANMVSRAEILEEMTPREQINDTLDNSRAKNDTTVINIGNRTITIIEKNGQTDVNIDRDEHRRRAANRQPRPFKGHWSGFQIGLNNYVDGDFSISPGPEAEFMELHAARSLNLNLNFFQHSLTIKSNNIGLVTGLGLELNNYRFANNVGITRQDGEIVPVDYDETGISLDRSRFRTYYLTVPLLLEFQSGHTRRSDRAYFSAGVIGGLNIGANTRVVYRDNSQKNRDRVRDDFYLSPFRYGLTVRTGYRSLNLYANYYPTGLFRSDRGPGLYPVAIGFSIIGF